MSDVLAASSTSHSQVMTLLAPAVKNACDSPTTPSAVIFSSALS